MSHVFGIEIHYGNKLHNFQSEGNWRYNDQSLRRNGKLVYYNYKYQHRAQHHYNNSHRFPRIKSFLSSLGYVHDLKMKFEVQNHTFYKNY